MTDTSQIAAYVVRIVVVVDHPERRSSSYPAVEQGRRIATERQFTSQRAALGLSRRSARANGTPARSTWRERR